MNKAFSSRVTTIFLAALLSGAAAGCAGAEAQDDEAVASELRTRSCPAAFSLEISDFRGTTDAKIEAAASMETVAESARAMRDVMKGTNAVNFDFRSTQRGGGECWYEADGHDDRSGKSFGASANLHRTRAGKLQLHVMSSVGDPEDSTGQLWVFVDVARTSSSGVTFAATRSGAYSFHIVDDGSDLVRIGSARTVGP